MSLARNCACLAVMTRDYPIHSKGGSSQGPVAHPLLPATGTGLRGCLAIGLGNLAHGGTVVLSFFCYLRRNWGEMVNPACMCELAPWHSKVEGKADGPRTLVLQCLTLITARVKS